MGVELREALVDEIREWLPASEPSYRAGQIFRGLQGRGLEPGQLTEIGKALRERLVLAAGPPVGTVNRVLAASDGTIKLLVSYRDGATVETVLMKTSVPGRLSQCISTQVGCAMGCLFCHSGIAGLKRHLSASEILAQVHLARPLATPPGESPGAGQPLEGRLTNIVLMGMGEPLHNYEAVARTIRILGHPEGPGLSTRRITVSTVGLVPQIERLGRDFQGQIGLAVSLHAGDSAVRRRLLPIEKAYDLDALVRALISYPLPPRRRITIEYTLIAGVNDDLEQARKLAKRLRGLPVKVNLIPMNEHEASTYAAPSSQRVEAFQEMLAASGLSVFVRRRRGADIAAACGQLALRGDS